MMGDKFTEKQGQYLAFIYNYTIMNGRPPAEANLESFFRTTPPTVHQMILKLEEKGFIDRIPGQARSIRLLVDPEEIPMLKKPNNSEAVVNYQHKDLLCKPNSKYQDMETRRMTSTASPAITEK